MALIPDPSFYISTPTSTSQPLRTHCLNFCDSQLWSLCCLKPFFTLFPKSQARSTVLLLKNCYLKKAWTEHDKNQTFSTSSLLPLLKSSSAGTTQGYLQLMLFRMPSHALPCLLYSFYSVFQFWNITRILAFQIISRSHQKFYILDKAFWNILSQNELLFLLHLHKS